MASVAKKFQDKVSDALKEIKTIEAFRENDKIVDYVLTVGRELFEKPLDVRGVDYLMRIGSRLAGSLAYLGQKASNSRAERDVYEQKMDEIEKEMFLEMVNNKYKVTEIRAKISAEVSVLKTFVIQKESEKNQYENILEATRSMLMFCQSAIKIKEGELYTSSRNMN